MVAFAALVRRPAAVPVDLVRRLGAAGPAGLPDQRRVRPGRAARHPGGRAHRRRRRRQGGQRRARPPHRPDARGAADRSASTRRGRPTRARSCARRRCSGETYVELSSGSRDGPKLRDGAQLPRARSRRRCSSTRSSTRSIRRRAGVPDVDAGGRGSRSPTAARTSTTRSPSCTRSRPTSTRCWRCCNRDSAATSTLLQRRRPGACCRDALAVGAPGPDPQRQHAFCATAARTGARRRDQGVPGVPDATQDDDRPRRARSPDDQAAVDELRPAAVQLSPALSRLACSRRS